MQQKHFGRLFFNSQF